MVLPLHRADGGPVSLGVGALLTAGTSSLHSTAHFGAEFRRAGRSLMNAQGDLQCRGQVGEVSCAFL